MLLNTAVFGTSGPAPSIREDGFIPEPSFSFAVGFSTFDNGAGDAFSNNSMQLTGTDGGFLPGSPIDLTPLGFDLATGTFGIPGVFHHAHIDLVLSAGIAEITVTLTDGTTGDTVTPFSNFDLSGFPGVGPFESRLAFGARCGAACADYDLDNVMVEYFAAHTVSLVDPSQGMWHLRDSTGAVTSFFYGNPGDVPFVGDWDCDGVATPGLFRQSDAFAYLRNSNTQGIADIRFFFGNPSDIPMAGDFNGNGCDTLSLYRPSTQEFFIVNKLGENEGGLGAAEFSFLFGNPGDKPVVGDWDGDGIDEVGLHRESTGFFYWRNTLDTGIASGEIFFGDPGDRFVAGDWGIVDGADTPAVFRPSNTTVFFRHTLTQGIADSQFIFGESGWLPVAGDFGLG